MARKLRSPRLPIIPQGAPGGSVGLHRPQIRKLHGHWGPCAPFLFSLSAICTHMCQFYCIKVLPGGPAWTVNPAQPALISQDVRVELGSS